MDNKYLLVGVLVIALAFMYLGTTMFYNSGLGLTDLSVEKNDANQNQYDVSYMLRSVRSFNSVDCQYTLLSADNHVIGNSSDMLNNITDGTFQMNKTIDVDANSPDAKKIEVKLVEINEKNEHNVMFDEIFDI